ncbi:hypothetical protein BDW59DRAFT_133272 [Aspergillus cavernicola]|uniref:LEA domain protein n=1 Tax=Aspergillus cavernicola TaxID=176166 RepID=A0ABR4HRY1_9EURO
MQPTTATTRDEQPSQPPKESTYTQPSNPITHVPSETTQPRELERKQGDPTPKITRGASSTPSTANMLSDIKTRHQAQLSAMQNRGDVDTDYGVEQQPNEGAIAHAVEGQSRLRAQAGAHAGAVGTAQGPGAPAYGEGVDTMADLGRKTDEHYRILGDRVGRMPGGSDGNGDVEMTGRERKLKQDRELHPADVVMEVTGDPVVGR